MGISNLSATNTGILLKDACVVIVRTEWNKEIVDKLEEGCRKLLKDACKVKTIEVPGAFEIPFAIKAYWDKAEEKPSAFVALGCVLRGDTPHFDYVCKGVTEGIMQLNLMLPVPSIFGILTVDNQLQANERLGGRHGHKGEEAGITVLKMMTLTY